MPPLLVFAIGTYLYATFGNPALDVDTIKLPTENMPQNNARLAATGAMYRLIGMLFAFMVAAIATNTMLAFGLIDARLGGPVEPHSLSFYR